MTCTVSGGPTDNSAVDVDQNPNDAVTDPKMRNWDVNRRMAGFWDPQMSIPMLRWLKSQQVYDDASIQTAMKQILAKTMMSEAFPTLTGEKPPQELVNKATLARSEFVRTEAQIGSFMSCMIAVGHERSESGPASALDRKSIKEWNVYWQNRKSSESEGLKSEDPNSAEGQRISAKYKEFPENVLDLFIRYCQLFYLFGEYKMAKRNLTFYIDHIWEFTTDAQERIDLRVSCLWGLIAAMTADLPEAKSPEHLQQKMQDAISAAAAAGSDSTELLADSEAVANSALNSGNSSDDTYRIPQYILQIDELVDSMAKQSRQKALLDRTWLVHRAIWPLMSYYFPKILAASAANVSSNPRSLIPCHMDWTHLIEWIFSDRIINMICTVCPHLLRYIAVIAILNKQRQDNFKVAVDAVARCTERYSDPFTSILESLFVKYDFDEAQEKLALCADAAAADFLLAPLQATLEENSRLLIFQTYCRIQKSINIDVIARKLHMTSETAERWIVNLIRHARLEAKIDSERNRVEIATQTQSVYQQVVDKTRNLVVRTNVLVQNLDRPAGSQTLPPTRTGGDFGAFRQRGRGEFGGKRIR